MFKRSAIFLNETCSRKCQRRIILNIAMSITPYPPLFTERASVLHGSVLDANYPAKWVSFGCKSTPWWFVAENGKVCLSVKYGSRVMELAKGKSAVEVAGPQELIKTLEALKAAVEAGELDAAIDTASQSLREGFSK
ncbi:MAG: DUF6641 family protein [Burkholderiaceae bacterium]